MLKNAAKSQNQLKKTPHITAYVKNFKHLPTILMYKSREKECMEFA